MVKYWPKVKVVTRTGDRKIQSVFRRFEFLDNLEELAPSVNRLLTCAGKKNSVSEASLAGWDFSLSIPPPDYLRPPVFSFPFTTNGSLVGGDIVYEFRRRLRHLCHALMYRQYLCQSFNLRPANSLRCGDVYVSVNDITRLLNSVRSLWRPSLNGTQTFSLSLSLLTQLSSRAA